jgi:AcrR family transcriptional regulator
MTSTPGPSSASKRSKAALEPVRAARKRSAPVPDAVPAVRAPTSGATPREPPEDRRQVLVNEAARLFGSKGYENTSMRDIAAAVGILPGSLYHHFPSKEALFVAVYSFGVEQIRQAVNDAVSRHTDPWARLEAACVAHLQTLLVKDSFAAAVISHLSIAGLPMRAELVGLRDRYEAIFRGLVGALPLPPGTDRRSFRLGLLGALNWSLAWYRPGGDSPASVARKLLRLLRRD